VLGEQPVRVAACEQTIEERARLGSPADHRQRVHIPERADEERILGLAEVVALDVAEDEIAALQFRADRLHGAGETRVVCNLGGISNITILSANGSVRGFDCGPANALLDEWAHRHLKRPFDEGGQFAAQGQVHRPLLNALLDEPFFEQPPPKSTGRDLFNPPWLDAKLAAFAGLSPEDVQATLVALTAVSIAREIERHASDARAVYVCGGGARNPVLMGAIQQALEESGVSGVPVMTTEALGVPPHQVEALAFAWLAMRCVAREPGNLASVTGAAGERVLGAVYPH